MQGCGALELYGIILRDVSYILSNVIFINVSTNNITSTSHNNAILFNSNTKHSQLDHKPEWETFMNQFYFLDHNIRTFMKVEFTAGLFPGFTGTECPGTYTNPINMSRHSKFHSIFTPNTFQVLVGKRTVFSVISVNISFLKNKTVFLKHNSKSQSIVTMTVLCSVLYWPKYKMTLIIRKPHPLPRPSFV